MPYGGIVDSALLRRKQGFETSGRQQYQCLKNTPYAALTPPKQAVTSRPALRSRQLLCQNCRRLSSSGKYRVLWQYPPAPSRHQALRVLQQTGDVTAPAL
jgi:hypothetical protein